MGSFTYGFGERNYFCYAVQLEIVKLGGRLWFSC